MLLVERDLAPAELAENNLDLPRRLSARYCQSAPGTVDRSEVLAEAYLGLVDAACRFDPARDASFRTFAAIRIDGAIRDAARRADVLPRRVRHRVAQMLAAEEQLLSVSPGFSEAQLAAELGWSAAELAAVRTHNHRGRNIQIDAVLGDELSVVGVWPDTSDVEDPAAQTVRNDQLRQLVAAVEQLPEMQRMAVMRLFGDRCSSRQVAAELGLSPQQLRTLRRRALAQLRSALTEPHPAEVRHVGLQEPGTVAAGRPHDA